MSLWKMLHSISFHHTSKNNKRVDWCHFLIDMQRSSKCPADYLSFFHTHLAFEWQSMWCSSKWVSTKELITCNWTTSSWSCPVNGVTRGTNRCVKTIVWKDFHMLSIQLKKKKFKNTKRAHLGGKKDQAQPALRSLQQQLTWRNLGRRRLGARGWGSLRGANSVAIARRSFPWKLA